MLLVFRQHHPVVFCVFWFSKPSYFRLIKIEKGVGGVWDWCEKRKMRLLPLLYNEFLSEEQVREHNCSDQIWVSDNQFRNLMEADAPGVVRLFLLRNTYDQTVVGTLRASGSHQDDDMIYVPHWMYRKLEMETDEVEIEPFEPMMCLRLMLQPHTSAHLADGDPQEILRDAFEHYTCVEQGDTLELWLGEGKILEITVQDTMPNRGPVCIRASEIELELLPPLDAPWPAPPREEPVPAPVAAEAGANGGAGVGGYTLGGTVSSEKSVRELRLEAALRRMSEQKKV